MLKTKPTLSEVAKKSGVSIPTVSQVLRETGRISEETRKKVIKAANELFYVRNNRAASMRSGDNNEIGILIHEITNPFNAEVINGLIDTFNSKKYLVSILDSQNNNEKEFLNLKNFISGGRRGIIWVPSAKIFNNSIELLKKNNVPTITFLNPILKSNFDHVGIKNFEAFFDSTNHLIKLGHKKIAYFGGIGQTYVRKQRISGYEAALKLKSLQTHIVWDCLDNKLAAFNETPTFLKKHPDVTGLVCNGDRVAIGVCQALLKLNKKIGKDISVFGMDDIVDSSLGYPRLSTVSISPYDLGRQLAVTMLNRIDYPYQPQVNLEITGKLILRETTGAPNKDL